MSYLDCYQEPIVQTVRTRVSCRTYQNRLLVEEDKEKLLEFCTTMKRGLHGEKISFQLTEYNADDIRKRKLAGYGMFKDARSFIVGVIDKSDFHYVSYGYAMEHVVLKATELGLATCWAGDFDQHLIKDIAISDNQIIPTICLVGYAADKQTLIEKAARFAIRASKRKDFGALFFNGDFKKPQTPENAGMYAESLELLRLAPSAGNTQPWRVVKEQDRPIFHFFKKVINKRYDEKKLHDIDIGIAMCHFELGAAKNGLLGDWRQIEHKITDAPKGTSYVVSWIPD
jgi:nitroreductase